MIYLGNSLTMRSGRLQGFRLHEYSEQSKSMFQIILITQLRIIHFQNNLSVQAQGAML